MNVVPNFKKLNFMKILSIAVLLFINVCLIFAQEELPTAPKYKEPVSFLEVPNHLKSRIEKFFSSLIKNEIKTAYDNILTSSPISRQKSDLDNLLNQTKRALDLYGKIEGFEPVNAEIATDSYIRLRYLGLHSNYPVRWIFTFYNSPEKDWIITNIKFDDLSEYFFKGD